ncbi:MAG TPA: pitrilysin family protein, partial [Candidatus Binatia bacterium]|nr:pitrilysin family protein [Candidatus Binatia bacterium]
DITVYFATMSRASIDTAIDMEAARMANVMLDGAQFEPEKKVIMEERRLGTEDSPVSALAELTSAITYTNHPYRRPVIGWMKDIENLTLEDLEIHYRTYYVPNNAFLVVVGDFSIPEMLTKIRSSFGKIPRGPDPPRAISEEPPQRGEKRVILKREAELPFLLIYYRTPNMNDPDSIALDVLTTILAGGRSARLYKELVYDKRLAPSVDVSYYGLSIDPTVLSITAQIMPGKSPDEVERVVDAVLDRIKAEPVSDQELEKAKNQIAAAFVFNQDGVYGQAITIGYFESAAQWQLINGYLDGVKKVSAADILRISRKYLDNDQRTIGTLIPTGGKKVE